MTLILGGARSGKSDYAETLAATLAPAGDVLYVATAQAWDDEMRTRIAYHRAQRPARWRTVEAPRGVGQAIDGALQSAPATVVLLDCMTLLTSNVLLELPEDVGEAAAMSAMEEELGPLLTVHADRRVHGQTGQPVSWIVVSNEVGLGIVPPYPLGRLYRDVLGRVNRRLAGVADTVYLMIAGLAQPLKS